MLKSSTSTCAAGVARFSASMLGVLAKYMKDVSVVRRLLFAVVFLSSELPEYWGVVLEFATRGEISKSSITPEQIKAITENLQVFNATAFVTDHQLQKELVFLQIPRKKPLGVILISPENNCLVCGSELKLRKDRSSSIVLYDDCLGTIPGAHFHKFCSRRTCSFVQHYGYYCIESQVIFNQNWNQLSYFISSRETGFSLKILRELDASVLIGQISFKQQADMYNYLHKTSCKEDRLGLIGTLSILVSLTPI